MATCPRWAMSLLLGTATVAPIPEPGTWALALAGFAVVGGALRRRRAPECAGASAICLSLTKNEMPGAVDHRVCRPLLLWWVL